MISRFLLPTALSLLALLSLVSCEKDDDTPVAPPAAAPCPTEGSLLVSQSLITTAGAQMPAGSINTRYEYDAAHRLVRMTDSPSQIRTSFAYSADGLQIVATRLASGPDTTVTTYVFNSVGYLTQKTIVPLRDTTLARREAFEYDGSGHLLRRTGYDGPAFANEADKLEYFWQSGNTTGYSFYAAVAGSTQTAEFEYFPDIRGTALSAPLPEADLLFALGKPYRSFPKNVRRKTTFEHSSGWGGGGSVVSNVVLDAGGRMLSFKTVSWSSIAPSDSSRHSTEYGYECR